MYTLPPDVKAPHCNASHQSSATWLKVISYHNSVSPIATQDVICIYNSMRNEKLDCEIIKLHIHKHLSKFNGCRNPIQMSTNYLRMVILVAIISLEDNIRSVGDDDSVRKALF
ncbi:hypothetical protein CDAR_378251 [Caerostris darwini]|uniref:Uncharacterized protein n=1 Tax=Caerostris darwini TaxID=1538125 RepID=A0AAV4T563_9ARAC|nr:hypothetical protein CDAR_378251 [Caerostris darwini]